MATTVTAIAPAIDAPASEWLNYWVKVRTEIKSWDWALSRHAMREVKRLSALVKADGANLH